MHYDAIVLAGGRSRRLQGSPKAQLQTGGRTLLATALTAAGAARRIVVVGPQPDETLPAGVVVVREDPPFAGPAAAVAAGLAAVAAGAEDWVLVLACDMPRVAAAVAALTDALAHPRAPASRPEAVEPDVTVASAPGRDGVIATDAGGHRQPLAAIYRRQALADAVARLRDAGTLGGGAMFGLIAGLSVTPVAVPAGSTDDVDTWEDADRLGVRAADAGPAGGPPDTKAAGNAEHGTRTADTAGRR